jgi:hypothetical protein
VNAAAVRSVTLALLAVVAACGSSAQQHPATANLQGTVTASPTCPVERQGQPCPPAPVAGGIEARDVDGNVMASGAITADGSYALSVRPGTYTLHVVVPAVLPRCTDTPATVRDGTIEHVDVHCDSGIR